MIIPKTGRFYLNLIDSARPVLKNIYVQRAYYRRRVYTPDMHKFTVYVTRDINEEAKKLLEGGLCKVSVWPGQDPIPKDALIRELKGMDALFCMLTDKIDETVLEKGGDNLKVIGTMSVGYDHLSLPAIRKRNIRVGYTPEVLTDATAELTLALLLATSRRLFDANEAARNGQWKAWAPFWMCGPGLEGSTVGIVGFGRIGQQMARLVKPFNVKKIIFYNRSNRVKQAEILGATQVGFETLLETSDFVIATCALTSETENMFNEDVFKKMKRTAIFINTSRGGLVDQEALVNALEKKEILAAGLDVMTPEPLPPNHALFKLKNCVILPHIGSAAIQTRNKMAVLTACNILAALNDEPMPAELKFECIND